MLQCSFGERIGMFLGLKLPPFLCIWVLRCRGERGEVVREDSPERLAVDAGAPQDTFWKMQLQIEIARTG